MDISMDIFLVNDVPESLDEMLPVLYIQQYLTELSGLKYQNQAKQKIADLACYFQRCLVS